MDYSIPWNLPQIYLFTANNVLNQQGCLIMGAGNAKAARNAYPELPRLLGAKIKEGQDFHLIWQEIGSNQFIGALQTKRQWRDSSPQDLLEKSLEKFKQVALNRLAVEFHCPLPGVGMGNLKKEEVLTLVEDFSNNVNFYHI